MAGYETTLGIDVLTGVESVRRRPGMYVGDVEGDGLYNLLWVLIEVVIDRHRPSGASRLEIEIDPASTVTIRDDGPGLPVDLIAGTRALETMFTSSQGRMIGIDAHLIANGLSETLVVKTTRDGERWTQAYARGIATTQVLSLGPSSEPGTTIRFRPDATIFPSIRFDLARIAERLHALAWLNPQLAICWQGRRLAGAGGIARWAEVLCDGLVEERIRVTSSRELVEVDLVLAWRGAGDPIVRTFANQHEAPRGPYADALWPGLAALASVALDGPIDPARARERLGPGLVAIVHVSLAEPRFEEQTHQTLVNPEAGAAVHEALARATVVPASRRFLLARLL